MPPRRSSRSRAPDAQPTPAGPSSTPSDITTGKRKRGQSAAANETDAETENVTQSTSRSKPASSSSRTRSKPSSTASISKGRASVGPERTSRASAKARSTKRLEEVPEIEEGSDLDEEGVHGEHERADDIDERRTEAPPARKRSRKSVDDYEEPREEEEEVRKPSRRGRPRQAIKEEEEADPPPAPKTRRSSAKPPSSGKTKTTRSSRRPLRVESESEEESEQGVQEKEEDKEDAILISDDENGALPVLSGGSRKPASRKAASKQSQSMGISSSKPSRNADSSEQQEDENIVLTPRPRKSAPAIPRSNPIVQQQATTEAQEDDLDGFDQVYQASPRRGKRPEADKNSTPSQASRTPRRVPPVEEEEEKSLLEPRVRPQSQSHPPPVEEAKGPSTRLVIHKMVLVNFKSYAGRQEIGPFHKVRAENVRIR